MSREFTSAKDKWNILSFGRGIRNRGNFEVGKTPIEVKMADASTRVQILVKKDFLTSLVKYGLAFFTWPNSEEDVDEEITSIQQLLVKILRTMLFPLDVHCSMISLNKEEVILNEPYLYEKSHDEACRVMASFTGSKMDRFMESRNQTDMLMPLGDETKKYGYCALRIDRHSDAIFKSVGGIVHIQPYRSSREPICGVAEYGVAAANRQPENLSAPPAVIDAWVRKQIDIINSGKLNDYERAAAAANLEMLGRDIEEIFFIATSEGGMGLDKLIDKICEYGYGIFPVQVYVPYSKYTSSLPNRSHSVYFRAENIQFSKFSVWGSIEIDKRLEIYRSSMVWRIIISALRRRGVEISTLFLENQEIGINKNIDSPYHRIFVGDQITSEVVKIIVQRTKKD